jgi:alpha-beta hydrolase superfamily lysophospholipase
VDGTAVLLLPPLGYEETASYRPLRVLAEHLAGAGRLVQRLDWPGLGDSALDAGDPARGPDTLAVVGALVGGLRARGFERVVGVGVRAGGLLAAAAGGFDGLALWGVPPTGRRYLREERAFQRL